MDDNPYVGPRAYATGENVQLYGRDRELTDLLGLLVSQRLVLLYSPSGAGKTSLIESKLVPELEQLRFGVFPRIRVGLEQIASPNRYLQSAMLSLRQGKAQRGALRHPREEFREFFQSLGTRVASGAVLIFDQFEEVLTLNPADTAVKEEFFAEVGDVLTNRRIWALFVIREEYLGALEPFLDAIPTRLASRYRLDLLSPEAARDALRGPAKERGVRFLDEAVDLLVEDLRTTKHMGYEGEATEVPGPVVEPVYLQVACHRLWEELRTRGFERDEEGCPIITPEDVARTGNVAAALRDYYGDVVERVAQATGAAPRSIRQWVGTRLITAGRFRNQIMREGRQTAGLDEKVIDRLSDAYLVRTERRPGHGVVWYELAHDRLIDPVLEDNASWFAGNPSELEKLAEFWKQHGRNKTLLLRGETLDEMVRGLGKTPELNAVEEEYLAASKAADQDAARRRLRRRRQAGAGLAIVSVIAAFSTVASVNLQWKNRGLQVENDTLAAQSRHLLANQSALTTRAIGQVQIRDTILAYAQAALVGPQSQRDDATRRLLDIIQATDFARDSLLETRVSGSTPDTSRASGPQIKYFARPSDQALVEAALQPLGYRLRREVPDNPRAATNQVLYGRHVPIEDVKRVALALVSAGVPIKRVAQFRTTRWLNSNEMQVLWAPQLDTAPALPVDSIRALSPSRPRVGPRLADPEPTPPARDSVVVQPLPVPTDTQVPRLTDDPTTPRVLPSPE